jgi:hypothetical protein
MAAYTSKEDEEFFGAVGRLAISWAQVELGLDLAIDIIHHYMGGQHVETKAPKLSLSRKTEYIRRWAKKVPEPTFREAVPKLMGQIEAASEIRHDLIHGVIIEQQEGSGEAELVRLIHSATGTERKYFKTSTVEILRAAVGAGKLASRSLHLGTELQKIIIMLAEKKEQSGD